MIHQCAKPLSSENLIDYLLGELHQDAEAMLEEHLFECPVCADRLLGIESIGKSVRLLVGSARIGGTVNRSCIDKMRSTGLSFREYTVIPDQTTSCTSGHEDFVLIRLVDEFSAVGEIFLEVEYFDLGALEKTPPFFLNPTIDQSEGEIFLLFPGEVVRNFPRSLWKMQAFVQDAGQRKPLGTFSLDHTP